VAHITSTVEGLTGASTITVRTPAATVVITPATATLAPGSTVRLVATARDASGAILDRAVSWSSSAPAIATVDASGLVTAVAPGNASIVAAVDARADTTAVAVFEPATSISLSASRDSLDVGESVVYAAQPIGRSGYAVNRPVTWTTTNPAVATVAASGTVTGRAVGVTTLVAQSDDARATKTLKVVAPVSAVELTAQTNTVAAGQTITIGASPRDAAGGALNRTVTWESSSPSPPPREASARR
jgi:uncharacterized protein YjdB